MATVAGQIIKGPDPRAVKTKTLKGQMVSSLDWEVARLTMKRWSAQRIAEELGQHVNTVRLIQRSPLFKEAISELADMAIEQADRIKERLAALADTAVDVVDEVLVSEEETAKVKLEAAKMVFDSMGLRKPQPEQPKVAIINQMVQATDLDTAAQKISQVMEEL